MKKVWLRALYVLAIVLNVIAVIGIACSTLCVVHGNYKAIATLVIGIILTVAASGMADAIERRK